MNEFKELPKLLNIKKPLLFFDLETTGPAISFDRVIEIAYMKIFPNGRVVKDDLLMNPECEISEESTEIHGIKNNDIQGKPTFREKAQELWEVFNNCFYSGYNIVNFDLPILRREFLRVGLDFAYKYDQIIDSKFILQYMEPRSLSNTYRFYFRKELPNALKSSKTMTEVEAAMKILLKQVKKYDEIKDIAFINEIHKNKDIDKVYSNTTKKFYWKNGETYFAFSRYKDKALSKIAESDRAWMEWLLTADFPNDLKHIVAKSLKACEGKRKPIKAGKK
jgi:DNA polymerase III subunit epsilon